MLVDFNEMALRHVITNNNLNHFITIFFLTLMLVMN
jgi:hypothetical protein